MKTTIYYVDNAKNGSAIAITQSFERALVIQDKLWKEHGIDTYITEG